MRAVIELSQTHTGMVLERQGCVLCTQEKYLGQKMTEVLWDASKRSMALGDGSVDAIYVAIATEQPGCPVLFRINT